MNRRRMMKLSTAGALTVAFGGGAIAWFSTGAPASELTLTAALGLVERLSSKATAYEDGWDLAQMYTHCAQSIEYSMTGYPEHKSGAYKKTVGAVAFSLFSARGRMSHGLAEPIPGAPLLAPGADPATALERLRQALVDFGRYQGELAPHFVYGPLSKSDYERAHAMHLQNHVQAVAWV